MFLFVPLVLLLDSTVKSLVLLPIYLITYIFISLQINQPTPNLFLPSKDSVAESIPHFGPSDIITKVISVSDCD